MSPNMKKVLKFLPKLSGSRLINAMQHLTSALLAGVVLAALALLLYVLFAYCDLAHRIELLSYTKVSSYEDLAAMSGKPDGKYYLSCDIDMAGKDWTPFTFNGVLDGNNRLV